MLTMSEELKLTIMMVFEGDDVPEAMMTKALQDLDIIMMHYEDGEAGYVISSMLKKALKENNLELLKKAMSYTESMARVNGFKDEAIDSESEALYAVSKNAIERFIKESDKEERIRLQIIDTLANENLIPIHYEKNFLVLYEGTKNILVACSVNGSFNKKQLADMTSNISFETLEVIHRFSEKTSVKFKFANLTYKRKQDNQFELKLEEF